MDKKDVSVIPKFPTLVYIDKFRVYREAQGARVELVKDTIILFLDSLRNDDYGFPFY